MRYIVQQSNNGFPLTATVTVVVDGESDNGDELVVIDPDEILGASSRTTLAELVAAAMNAAMFEPVLCED